MKQLILIFFLGFVSIAYSQEYFNGNYTYCTTENPRAQELFDSGIEVLHLNSRLNPEYINKNRLLFLEAVKTDSTFCDAYFFVGYTSRLLNEFDLAIPYYYLADSLSPKPAFEFKQNLAITSLIGGAVELAQLKYSEMKKEFPTNPEGFYGFALTTTMTGEYEMGLENITTALRMYNSAKDDKVRDAQFIKAILLTLSEEYEKALPLFEQVKSKFKKDHNFRVHYSLALLKIGEKTKDEKMKANAKKVYNSIEEKEMIPEFLVPLYKF